MDEPDDAKIIHIAGVFSANPIWWRTTKAGELIVGPVETNYTPSTVADWSFPSS